MQRIVSYLRSAVFRCFREEGNDMYMLELWGCVLSELAKGADPDIDEGDAAAHFRKAASLVKHMADHLWTQRERHKGAVETCLHLGEIHGYLKLLGSDGCGGGPDTGTRL